MISFNIDTNGNAGKLVKIARKYEEDIDVICGRYIIDAKSILGILSLMGEKVNIKIHTDDENVKKKFEEEVNNESISQ